MEKENTLSIWLGHFRDENAFRAYLEETYDEEGDVSSPFLRDFQVSFLDHDLVESAWFGKVISAERLASFSYADSFIQQLDTARLKSYNSILIAYDFEYSQRNITGKGLEFIGAFPFQQK